MNEDYIRTDLANECRARVSDEEKELEGIEFSEKKSGNIIISKLTVKDERGAEKLGKPIGRYITIGFGEPWLIDAKECRAIKRAITNSIIELIGINIKKVLVIGLGNRHLTSDSIGPLTIDEITVTRQISISEPSLFAKLHHAEVSAIAPGVSGETGLESADIVAKAAELAAPDAIIVVDSLVARAPDRLMRTVQLCDTGISPGSGVGNQRKAINSETLGVPVIALGVPCVVDSSTLVWDALTKGGMEADISGSLKRVLDSGKNFFVSLKECDVASRELSLIISEAIDEALISS